MQKFLFNNAVHLLMTNRKMGDFHPLSENFRDRLNPVLDRLGAIYCLNPVSDFTNRVFVDVEIHPGQFTRSPDFADAIVTKNSHRALMIATADCFAGVVFDPGKRGLALVHLGLKSIYREDGDRSVLENVVRIMGGKNMLFWFGGGIGNCCYGINDPVFIEKIKDRFGSLSVNGEVEKGPRRGFPAIDLHNIIYNEAVGLGLEVCSDRTSDICTSCYAHPNPNGEGFGRFFSNVRDSEAGSGVLRPRNGVFVMMK